MYVCAHVCVHMCAHVCEFPYMLVPMYVSGLAISPDSSAAGTQQVETQM